MNLCHICVSALEISQVLKQKACLEILKH